MLSNTNSYITQTEGLNIAHILQETNSIIVLLFFENILNSVFYSCTKSRINYSVTSYLVSIYNKMSYNVLY